MDAGTDLALCKGFVRAFTRLPVRRGQDVETGLLITIFSDAVCRAYLTDYTVPVCMKATGGSALR